MKNQGEMRFDTRLIDCFGSYAIIKIFGFWFAEVLIPQELPTVRDQYEIYFKGIEPCGLFHILRVLL